MQFQNLMHSIKRKVVMPVYLLQGDEEYLQELIVQAFKEYLLARDVAPFNLDELDGEGVTPSLVVERAITLPVFAEKRLVIVKNPLFLTAHKKEGETQTNPLQDKVLLDYLADPPLFTCLVLWVTGSVDKRRKLVKAVEKAGQIVEINSLRGEDLSEWIKGEIGSHGKNIEPQALEFLILHGTHSLRSLKNELQKMILYCSQEETISLAVVEKLLTMTGEANIFTLVDNIGLQKGEGALLELRSLLEAGEPAVRILFMIARHFRLLLSAKDLAVKGYSEKKTASELSLHPYVTGKLLRQGKNFSFRQLEDSLRLILDCDIALKTGAAPRPALENLLLGLLERV